MRYLGLIVILLVAAGIAAAPSKGITNPLTANLDAGGYNIDDVGSLTAQGNLTAQANIQTSGWFVGGGVVTWGNVQLEPENTAVMTISGGNFDPSVRGLFANPGSLYLRGFNETSQMAELWFKTGLSDFAWMRVSP